MAFTYDLSTDVGKVRLLIPDSVSSDHIFSDEELTAILTMESDNVKRATAAALDTLASSEAYQQQAIRVLGIQNDGPAVAKELRERAKTLRTEADRDELADAGGAFDIAEMVVTPSQARERRANEALRG